MSDSKPLASLSPTLLARKGGARPAMRQALSAMPIAAMQPDHDDLGWNDMGECAPVVPLQRAEVLALHQPVAQLADPDQLAPLPEVVRQQRALTRQVAAPQVVPMQPPVPIDRQANRRSALAEGRRAAFTLRLEAERHLKLRLACTIKACSAQALVTEALDRLLAEIPDATEFASKLATRHA